MESSRSLILIGEAVKEIMEIMDQGRGMRLNVTTEPSPDALLC